MDATDRLIRRADELVAEVIAPYRGVLPDELIETIRVQLMAELVVSPDGRAELRRTMADVIVEESGERGGALVDDEENSA